jgi:pyruvate/2-oxoglutarate dehydrogenase complex dihydrolipoamide dehydrogenase (E3) component
MLDPANPRKSVKRPELRDGILRTDLCILGGGSGGLSMAAAAVQMGASVVLIEKGRMGGDCLNTGCVPSKALIAAAHVANVVRHGSQFGLASQETVVDFRRVHQHVHGVIDAIAPHDSVERFEGLGVEVIQAPGRFTSPDMVEAGGQRIQARRYVVATGSRAALPPIPGLKNARYLTNESLFELTELPRHLIVIGGGPIGIEMAQTFRRLGSAVTVVEKFGVLAKDEPEAVEIIRRKLNEEGIRLLENTGIGRVDNYSDGVRVTLDSEAASAPSITGSHILVATGRLPNIEGLNLSAAEIEVVPKGIVTDAKLRTSNRRVYAIGDVAGGPQFTHIAGYHASVAIKNILFSWPAKVSYAALPWVTYSDPELAHVGLTEADAHAQKLDLKVLSWPLAMNDRAQAERATDGLAKIVLGKRGRILGATIVGPRAGELIGTWGLAISSGLTIGALATSIAPYPTLSEITKRVAGSNFTPTLYGSRTRALVGLIQRFLP